MNDKYMRINFQESWEYGLPQVYNTYCVQLDRCH